MQSQAFLCGTFSARRCIATASCRQTSARCSGSAGGLRSERVRGCPITRCQRQTSSRWRLINLPIKSRSGPSGDSVVVVSVVPVVVVVSGGSGESSARRAEALNVAASAHAHASAIVCLTFIERSPRIRSHATVPQWWPLVVRVVRRSPAPRVSKLRDKSHEAGVGLRPRWAQSVAEKQYLLTPGPPPVPPQVLAALAEPV